MEVSSLDYVLPDLEDRESDVSVTIKSTLSEGLNHGGVIAFRIPRDTERFTDLSSISLSIEFQILKNDGTAAVDDDKVWIDSSGIHSFFSTCQVSFNGEVASTTNAYPQTASLCRRLGENKYVRETCFDVLDGTWQCDNLKRTDITDYDENKFMEARGPGNVVRTLYGKIYSDVLQSCGQLLPPGVSIGVDLRRANDYLTLDSIKVQEAGVTFKPYVISASLYVRRLKLQPTLHQRVLQDISDGATLKFNRLETRVMTAKTGSVFRWLDCLNGAPLPNRLYVGLVSQLGFYGSINHLSCYFENFSLTSFQAKLSGRDLLVEPIRTEFKKEDDGDIHAKSNGVAAFRALLDVIGHTTNPNMGTRVSYKDFIFGTTILALELGKCGEKSGTSGAIDLEFQFGDANQDICIILFTESTSAFTVRPIL
jgi:hypothetical protein